ncbi:MAG: hypothetical protein JWN46_414 [Acidimicrobiales bacterium]|nr:hypothetical protein [Acidimicrobiales bacterium]
MRKLIAAAGATTAMAVGGLAVAAVNPLMGVSAQTPAASTPAPAAAAPAGPLKRALDGLVQNHTITQAQADAVRKAVAAEVKKGGLRPRPKARGQVVAVAAKAIGITPAQLRAGLKAGHSIADQANAKHVAPKSVADAIVAAATKRIDAAVTAGKLTPERAARLKKRLPTMADRIVNAKPGPHGGFGGGGLRPGG